LQRGDTEWGGGAFHGGSSGGESVLKEVTANAIDRAESQVTVGMNQRIARRIHTSCNATARVAFHGGGSDRGQGVPWQ
jgi:hypothetical protein